MISIYNESYNPVKSQDSLLVGGCFDVLHYGHMIFLKEAKALGKHLIIALEGDEAIVETKDRKVFHNQQQRAEILDGLTVVDEVILLPNMTSYEDYLKLVQCIRPKFIALTKGDPQYHNKELQAKTIAATCVIFPFEKGFSTTDLLDRYCLNNSYTKHQK